MNEQRVLMWKSAGGWRGNDDVRVSSAPDGPLVGRRFAMDVSEAMLAQIGARGLEQAVDQLGRAIAYEHRDDIQRTVQSYLMDRAWAQPIIEEELRRAVREFVRELFRG